jgi:hypothetical protein
MDFQILICRKDNEERTEETKKNERNEKGR